MPRRELKYPHQIDDWLRAWGQRVSQPCSLILVGSGALLWQAFERGIGDPLPEESMDVDPITEDEAVAELAYEAMIGSEFELKHGWHVNLMPSRVLDEFPSNWRARAAHKNYGPLEVIVPAPADLLVPKLRRGEPRDRKHAEWAIQVGLVKEKEVRDGSVS